MARAGGEADPDGGTGERETARAAAGERETARARGRGRSRWWRLASARRRDGGDGGLFWRERQTVETARWCRW
ncbi:hypothetical protein Scep_021801 [Stephania cephalantha]|uniref:Uncharacterized protein n=1 Tax=Stephania cephalantha TaxID=152367 RepID=A0AAP0F9M9_9MAGN